MDGQKCYHNAIIKQFMRKFTALCASHNEGCGDCPFNERSCAPDCCTPLEWGGDADNVIAIVERWYEEHKRKVFVPDEIVLTTTIEITEIWDRPKIELSGGREYTQAELDDWKKYVESWVHGRFDLRGTLNDLHVNVSQIITKGHEVDEE